MLFLHYVIKKLVCLAADFKRGSMKNTQTSEEERIYGELYERDSRFVASCRKLQSIYRVEIGEPICPYIDSHNKVHRYGNYIGLGDISGKNFLEKYTFDYANKRVEKKKEYETISSTRLYNNLLSSQPMAFNLFCPLRQILIDLPEEATRVIRAALPMYPICKAVATDDEIIEAAKKACCHDFIMGLPSGYDTMVGEGGCTLSGGEKQRLSIARAMLKDAPVVLLDEATASLDPENEVEVQKAINTLIEGRTVIVIAHKLRTIKNADKIVVLDGGRISEEGTHEMLMRNNGIYRKLWDIQEQCSGWRI